MKRIVFLALLFAALSTRASAAWRDLKEGLDPQIVARLVGAPLIETGSRRGVFVNWIYDNGGYVYFENGRVKFWQAPRDVKP